MASGWPNSVTSVLIVDMMLAAGDNAPEFTAANTRGYMLTGLELLKILDVEKSLSGYRKVTIYTALRNPDHLSRVRSWLDAKNTARRGRGPTYELRPKANVDHDDLLRSILLDLGLDPSDV
jgi:hypothetical protein